MLTIRPANAQDIELIRELTFIIWPQTYGSILSEEQIAYMLAKMYARSVLQKQMEGEQQFILCYDNNEPVGFAAYGEIGQSIYKLQKIYILPDRQGRGIGRFMLDHITAKLREQNATALDLNVNRYNTPAQAFYEKTGFKIIREEDIDIGGGYFMNDYVFRLGLK